MGAFCYMWANRIQHYQENIDKIQFFDINDKSYNLFEYTIKDGVKVIGDILYLINYKQKL